MPDLAVRVWPWRPGGGADSGHDSSVPPNLHKFAETHEFVSLRCGG